jgi:hypothetical protein
MLREICQVLAPPPPPPPAWPNECVYILSFLILLVIYLAAYFAVATYVGRSQLACLNADNAALRRAIEDARAREEAGGAKNRELTLALDKVRMSLCKNEKEDDWGSIFELRDQYALPF